MSMLKLLTAVGSNPPATYVDDVFSAYTYTGNGSTQTINNGIDLAGKGGLVWIKNRNAADVHSLCDSMTGVQKALSSNSTGSQRTLINGLTAFTSSGFSVGSESEVNGSTILQASWTFRKAPKFFDVVTYTGDGTTNRNIAHSLGVAPGMVIVKRTNTTGNWSVWHRGGTQTNGQYAAFLNSSGAYIDQGVPSYFGTSLSMSASTFSVGGNSDVNANGGSYVAYLFAHDPSADGIVQCGSFSGNATVELGWEPQYLILKSTSLAAHWSSHDTTRGWTNVTGGGGVLLRPNTSDSELAAANGYPTATGFTINGYNGVDGIYLAIRRPNKPPTVGTQVYNAIARTGTGAAATVSGVGFAPDLVMSKARSASGTCTPYDKLRGALAFLQTSATNAESSAFSDTLTSFGMDGVSIGADASFGSINYNAWTFINHFFKRAVGFFDEVCDTGTGAAHTIAHNLTVAPELMIRKGRSGGTQWEVWHSAIANTEKLILNSTAAKATDTTAWNSTSPTASVFTVGTGANVNTNTATYVTYLFATLSGISKCGTYTGNGTTQNIEMGFTTGARFILVKATSTTGSWWIFDSTRGVVSSFDPALQLNSTAAEITSADAVDPDASGIIVNQEATCSINASGVSYVYLAIS